MTDTVRKRKPRPPKILHQFWDRPDIPTDVSERMDEWRDRHPAWAYIRWSDQSAESLVLAHFGAKSCARYRACTIASMRSDLLRYAALSLFGGVYLDADLRCINPIDPMMNAPLAFAHQTRADGEWQIHTNFMIAEPQHPLFNRAWKEAMAGILASGRKRFSLIRGKPLNDVNTVTGPRLLTHLWKDLPEAKRNRTRLIEQAEARRHYQGAVLSYRRTEGSWKQQQKTRRIVDFDRTPG